MVFPAAARDEIRTSPFVFGVCVSVTKFDCWLEYWIEDRRQEKPNCSDRQQDSASAPVIGQK